MDRAVRLVPDDRSESDPLGDLVADLVSELNAPDARLEMLDDLIQRGEIYEWVEDGSGGTRLVVRRRLDRSGHAVDSGGTVGFTG